MRWSAMDGSLLRGWEGWRGGTAGWGRLAAAAAAAAAWERGKVRSYLAQ